MRATRPKTQLCLTFDNVEAGEARRNTVEGTEARTAKTPPKSPTSAMGLMEEVCERQNLQQALRRVRANKGSPGVDGMTVDELPGHLKTHWPTIRTQLLKGIYTPQPVKRVDIPKPGGGTRALGVPTVLDRFIQQAALQVLQRDGDPTFSPHSYGFRPHRSAHQAVTQAQAYIADGYRGVVDIDLEKFFDRVNHDVSTMVRDLATYLTGWRGYFGRCETPSVLRDLDSWIHRRLRCVVWKQWKRGRRRYAELRRLSVGRDLAAKTAGSPHGPWRLSRSPALSYVLPNAFFASLGLPRLAPSSMR